MNWSIPRGDTYFASLLTADGFEIDHLRYALRWVKSFRTAIDGGAHIGTWTVEMSKHFKRVYAFEPARDSFNCLKDNVALKPHCPVEPYNAALGADFGLVYICDDPTRKGNTGARMVGAINGNVVGTQIVQLAIDSLKLEDLDFLKLDVEGYEIEALKGAERTLRNCRPVVMLECKKFTPPRLGGPNECVKLLQSLRYREVGGIRNDRVFVNDR